MPLQNRVLPTGEIVADPARGLFTGNRGIIHLEGRKLGAPRWSHHAWICCTLDWQSRRRDVMSGRKWTELFFLDEAVSLAAGHRPCGYCRRSDYLRFVDAWDAATGARPKAAAMDKALHAARIVPRSRRQLRHKADLDALPDGAFVRHSGAPHLVRADALFPYTPQGYGPPVGRTQGALEVLTPAPILAVLRAGYAPVIHPSADDGVGARV